LNAALLLLADSRLPAGAHAHSGGLEPAASTGLVHDVGSLEDFLRGRLETAGAVAAGLAMRAASLGVVPSHWLELDQEADARTPSPAQRAASRQQGRALLRVARAAWPHPVLELLSDPHHPVALGAVVAAAGGTPGEAARIALTMAITGPASAAIRLLGLDPIAVHAMLAGLTSRADTLAADLRGLPAVSAPLLDLFAELHRKSEVRLFES
jgi:urease accessory protein